MSKKTTKEHIMETAIMVFADKGYSGATMDFIAEQAKVNKAAIYYHLGNKKKLYFTVISNFIEKNREIMQKNYSPSLDSKTNLSNILRLLNNSSPTQRAVFRILFREVASGWETLPKELFKEISTIFIKMREILKPSIEKNEINEKDTLITHIFLFGSILLLNNLPIIRKKLISSGHFPLIKEFSHQEEIENYINILINGFFIKGE